MAVSSSVFLSQIEYLRFDAEYYQPKHLEELKKLEFLYTNAGVSKLSRIISCRVRTGRTPSVRKINENDDVVVFVKTDGIREGRVDFNSAGALPLKSTKETDFIKHNSIVVTIIGATPEIVGRAAIIRNNDPPCVTNQNIAVITTNEKCNPYYLTAFLQTSFARNQFWRHARRTEQVNLNCREVERILVLTPFRALQDEIGNLVENSFTVSDEAKILYTQAQQLLESELGLDTLRFDKPVGYVARFSDLEESQRLDAQHYQPRFEKLLKHLEKYNLKLIRDIKIHNKRGIQPLYTSDGKCAVVNSQHLGQQHIMYDALQKTTLCAFNASKEAHIHHDDLLIYTTGAYIGRTNVYLDKNPALASNHVNVLRLMPDIDHAYMAMVLQSIIGQFQTQKHARGSAQAELYSTDIDKFFVPLLPQSKQTEIGNLLRDSFIKQRESIQLLAKAKNRVEELIEQGAQA